MRDGKLLCPSLLVLPPDPWKYRNVHLKLQKLLGEYTNRLTPKSIDEFVLDLDGCPCVVASSMQQVAGEIKRRIKREIGEWLTVSVGIAPNRLLAKTAAGLRKPDGLDEIYKKNFREVYRELELGDLCGIATRNTLRLNSVGVYSVMDFYEAPLQRIKAAFNSINAYYWYLRLRGFEIDDVEFMRRSYGNSFALPKPLVKPEELSPILTQLIEKVGMRLRRAGYWAQGVHLAVSYRDGNFWHGGVTTDRVLFDSRDFYKEAFRLLLRSPRGPVRDLHVSCFGLVEAGVRQLDFFDDLEKRKRLTGAVDRINERWGNFVVVPGRMAMAEQRVLDRIAFGAAGSENL